jgi:electron transfer flavoprotein alpha/beta subunit
MAGSFCVVIADPRPPAGGEARGRPSQRALNRQLTLEDALLGLAVSVPGATAIVIGGRAVRGAPRHALTAGVADVVHIPVDGLERWTDADAARLVADAVGGYEIAVVGVEGAGGWDGLAGQIAEHAGVGCCSALVEVRGYGLTEHDLDHERVVLEHTDPFVTTAARLLLASAPTFGYEAVAASAGREVVVRQPAVARAGTAPRFARCADAPRRREVVSGEGAAAAAAHFLRVIGAVR